jgi:hypothetical protein
MAARMIVAEVVMLMGCAPVLADRRPGAARQTNTLDEKRN